MKDLLITNQKLPIIDINFEEVKEDLKEQLEGYKSLVVTDESLSLCKNQQKSLAGLKGKIDTYRKDVKRVMSEPIIAFEDKCKQLVSLIEQAEQPLKDGIKVFDDMKREEKRAAAQIIINAAIVKHGLLEKYAYQLTVVDKYLNLTSKTSEVKEDVDQRIFVLVGQQQKEQELLELIQDAIDTVNKSIKKQVNISSVQWMINRGMSTKEVIQSINSLADQIREAENPKPVEEIVPPIPAPPIPTTLIEPAKNQVSPPPPIVDEMWVVDMRITAKASQFGQLKQYMLSSGITYSVKDKQVVE
jgi:hypothetical protein